jgi:hypothetical protein
MPPRDRAPWAKGPSRCRFINSTPKIAEIMLSSKEYFITGHFLKEMSLLIR